MEGEIWKDVRGYEGYYKISNLGNLKGLTRTVKGKVGNMTIKGNNKKKIKSNIGYYRFALCANSITKKVCVHRLLAQHFIPNPENKPTVNHINGIKTDNRIENLEWNTYYENNVHALVIGLRKKRKIKQLTKGGELIKIWDSSKDAAVKLKINRPNITSCTSNNRSTAGGFKWEYV